MRKAVLVAMLASGCVAADSDTIKPQSVSAMGYAQSDCAALAAEDQRVADRLFRISILQDRQRTSDVVGVVLIGVTPTGVGTPEYSDEISRLKGERETIAGVKAKKACLQQSAVPDEAGIWAQLKQESAARRVEQEAKRAASR